MNSIERINAVANYEQPDRPPVIAQVFAHAATLGSESISDYVRDGELLARLQIEALKHYRYDAVFGVMGATIESEAMGAEVSDKQNFYPYISRHPFSNISDALSAPAPDPTTDGRMPQMLRALEIMRNEIGGETLVVGCIVGPMTTATQLLGIERALYAAIDDADQFCLLLDKCAAIAIDFGIAQIKAGAHVPLVFDPSACGEVVPPAFYKQLIAPRQKKIMEQLKKHGADLTWLHIAGKIADNLPAIVSTGVDIINFDYCVKPTEIMELAPGAILDGNIKSINFIESEPEQIAAEAKQLLETFAERGGFILSSGCEIPPEAKPENISAMVKAVF